MNASVGECWDQRICAPVAQINICSRAWTSLRRTRKSPVNPCSRPTNALGPRPQVAYIIIAYDKIHPSLAQCTMCTGPPLSSCIVTSHVTMGQLLTRIIHVNQHDNDKVGRQLLTFIVATHNLIFLSEF